MIVISGALVLVAFVLLVIGLVGQALPFVWASIGASVAAFGFLVVGILQRRQDASVVEGVPGSAQELTEVIRTPETRPVTAAEIAANAVADVAGTVLVVEGRPRYHVAGCRYLAGKDATAVEVAAARADGFSACGVCRPDAALAVGTADTAQDVVEAPEAEAEVVEVAVVKAPAARKAPAKAAATTATKTATKTAAKAAPKTAAKAAPAKVAAKAPAKAAKAAPAKAAKPGVVVIPDRDKFHTPSCRFVPGVAGATEVTKAAASRKGLTACGVCKP